MSENTKCRIQELIKDIQSGGAKLGEIKDHFPESLKGSMAKQYWNNSFFAYGVEYGALIILNHLLEAEGLTQTPNQTANKKVKE